MNLKKLSVFTLLLFVQQALIVVKAGIDCELGAGRSVRLSFDKPWAPAAAVGAVSLAAGAVMVAFSRSSSDSRVSLEELLERRWLIRPLLKAGLVAAPFAAAAKAFPARLTQFRGWLHAKLQAQERAGSSGFDCLAGADDSVDRSLSQSLQGAKRWICSKVLWALGSAAVSDFSSEIVSADLAPDSKKILRAGVVAASAGAFWYAAYKTEDWLDALIYDRINGLLWNDGVLLVPSHPALMNILNKLPILEMSTPKYVIVRQLRQVVRRIIRNNKKLAKPTVLVPFSMSQNQVD